MRDCFVFNSCLITKVYLDSFIYTVAVSCYHSRGSRNPTMLCEGSLRPLMHLKSSFNCNIKMVCVVFFNRCSYICCNDSTSPYIGFKKCFLSLSKKKKVGKKKTLCPNFTAVVSPASRSFMKTLKITGPIMEPWGTPLVTGHQPDVTPFAVTLWAWPTIQLFTHLIVYLSSCMLDILSRRILWETVSKALLKSKKGLRSLSLLQNRNTLVKVICKHTYFRSVTKCIYLVGESVFLWVDQRVVRV